MSATVPGLAVTPEQVTADWLSEVLEAADCLHGARVIAVDLSAVGTGQMCDTIRATIRTDRDSPAPASLIIKQPAADATSRQTAATLRSYEVEVRFYQELAATLPVRSPVAYFAGFDEASGDFSLVLEDLAPAQQGDQLHGCSVVEARAALDELVALHADRWGDASLESIEWLDRDHESQAAFLLDLLPALWPGFLQRYDALLPKEVRSAGQMLFGNLESYFGADSRPWTIVHGDFRLDNLLFDPRPGGRVAVVDWQLVSVGPAMNDVAYLLGAGLLPEERRLHEAALVRRYHDALQGAGVGGYDFASCWRDYRRGSFSGLIVAVAASMLVERTARGDEMFLAMAERHARHILDLDAGELLGAAGPIVDDDSTGPNTEGTI